MRAIVVEDQHFGVANGIEAAIVRDVTVWRIRGAQVIEQIGCGHEQGLIALFVALVLDRRRQVRLAASHTSWRLVLPATKLSKRLSRSPSGHSLISESVTACSELMTSTRQTRRSSRRARRRSSSFAIGSLVVMTVGRFVV